MKISKRWIALLSLECILVLLLLIVALWIFGIAVNIAFIEKKDVFDFKVFDAVTKITNPTTTNIMLAISFLGKHPFLIPANILLLIYFIYKKNKRLSVRVASLSLSSLLLMLILKNSFHRQRPDMPLLTQVSGYSFPSGHSMMSMVFYGLIIYIVIHEPIPKWKKMLISCLLALLILVIGFSRIYLRVHYASDVMAGFAVGFIWLMLSLWTIDKIENRRITKKPVPAE